MKKIKRFSFVIFLAISSCSGGSKDNDINPIIQNSPPVITSSSIFSADENQTSVGQVIAYDPEEDTLSYSISGSDLNISSSGVLTFAISPDYETQNVFLATVNVSDGSLSSTQDITININDIQENDGLSFKHYGNADEQDRLLGMGRYEDGVWVEYITFLAISNIDVVLLRQPSIRLNNFIYPNRTLELGFSDSGASMMTKGEIIEFFIGDSTAGADYGALSIRSVDGVFGGELQVRNAQNTGGLNISNTNDEYVIHAKEFDYGDNISITFGVK